MIRLKNKETGEAERVYNCSPQKIIELCFANIECLLHIALADPDEHIKELGGEDHLITLMERYRDLIISLYPLVEWRMIDKEEADNETN